MDNTMIFTHPADLLPEQLAASLKDLGQPAFRGKQIFRWLSGGVWDFSAMLNLPLDLREKLAEAWPLAPPELVKRHISADGTEKYLWQFADGEKVETVLMRQPHGDTICISTQVGCRMGCVFCASTIGGLARNLTPREMLAQVLFVEQLSGKQASNIVLMGMGEPLDNFEAVVQFLRLVTHPDGRGLSMRHITLSTCGMIEKIDKLANLGLQLTLSISLHGSDDETRGKIMPINKACGVDKLFRSAANYRKKTGRRVSIEYALIDGINDREEQASALAAKCKHGDWHVNLIPLNAIGGTNLQPSSSEQVAKFARILEKNGVNVTIRRRRGDDIAAACGQLRHNTARRR